MRGRCATGRSGLRWKTGAFRRTASAAGTRAGGVWDWDYQQEGGTASVSVDLLTASDAQLRNIDRTIDDGDLTTGLLRKIGSKAGFIIEP